MKHNRRRFVLDGLSMGGHLGLTSFLLGVPTSFLSRRLIAQTDSDARFCVYSSDFTGSPVNTNAPLTYQSPQFQHPTVAEAGPAAASIEVPQTFSLGGRSVMAAGPWGQMPQVLRGRFHFLHHSTLANAHTEAAAVLEGMGTVKGMRGVGSETVPSAIADSTAAMLGTITAKPIVLGRVVLKYHGSVQSVTPADTLKSLFAESPNDATLKKLSILRDQQIDLIYKDLKQNGTSAQRQFFDNYALAKSQASKLGESLSQMLAAVGQDPVSDQIIAAAALCATKSTPMVVINIPFGGDNHRDRDLSTEVEEFTSGVAAINLLWEKFVELGLTDKANFIMQNVFGRSLKRNASGGRNHNSRHAVSLFFGPDVKPGVSGNISVSTDRNGGNCTAINSVTGQATNADIVADDTLASSVKTAMKICGLPEKIIEERVNSGKIIRSIVS